MKFNDSPDWGSHVLALAEALARTSGPVMEWGIGLYSTPMLTAMCKAMRRTLVSVEHDIEWMQRVRPEGTLEFTTDVADLRLLSRHPYWGVVFLDQGPTGSERWPVAIEALHCADIVVLHDWNEHEEHIYRYREKVLPQAKAYVIDNRLSPATLILSNQPHLLKNWPVKDHVY